MWRWLVLALMVGGCAQPGRVQFYAVDFGTVAVGEVHEAPLRVRNDFHLPNRLLRVEQRDGDVGFTVVPRYTPLEWGDENEWSVRFDALQPGPASARFTAVFQRGEAEFTVTANAAPECAGGEGLVDFGDGDLGPRALEFLISNDGTTPGRVFLGELAPPFSSDVTGFLVLAPRARRTVKLRFDGADEGLFEQRWKVQPSPDCAPTEMKLVASVRVSPLTLSPGRLHFGDIVRERRVTLTNSANAPIRVTPALFGDGYRLPDAAPFLVPAGGAVAFIVERTDFTSPSLLAELVFTTDATSQRELRVPLLARHTRDCVTPLEHDVGFPVTELACTSPARRVTLKNECPHPVRVGAPMVEAPFAVAAANTGALAAGATAELAMTFTPREAGGVGLPLIIPVDVLDGAQRVVVGLSARGDALVLREETYTVPPAFPPLDVLLIIDDTPVMAPYAESLQENLGLFARSLSANFVSPRVGVSTTSMRPAEQGRLRRTPSGAGWLDAPTPAELQALGAYRGAQAGDSSCLEALDAALKAPLRDDPMELGGFLRPNAALMVVCVTANADAVREASSTVFARVKAAAPATTSFNVIARFTEQPGCTGTHERGVWNAIVRQTNGVKEELCTPGWASTLERIGKTALSHDVRVPLRRTPDLLRAPLRVYVNGFALPQHDPVFGSRLWLFDAVLNQLVFEPPYAPAPGETVRVTYAPACAE